MSVLVKMDWFWQKLIKAICYGQNSFVTTKAARKCLFWPKWLYFNKSCSKLCLWAKKALLWQKLFKTVCFYHNGLTSAKATQNCVFCQNSLISAKTHRPNESKGQTGLKRSLWLTCPNESRWQTAEKNQNGKLVQTRQHGKIVRMSQLDQLV